MKATVVVGYDGTPPGERALAEAGREAVLRGASVDVVHALQWFRALSPQTYVPVQNEEIAGEARRIASSGAEVLRQRHPDLSVTAEVTSGAPGQVLAKAAHDADLLVLGSRGRGAVAETMLGSVVLRTLAHTTCPVMVARGTEHPAQDTVLVAVDVEDAGDAMLNFAFAEAAARSAKLHAVYAADLAWARMYLGDTETVKAVSAHTIAAAQTALDRVLYVWRAQYPQVRVQTAAVDGAPATVLIKAATSADVVVTGAHRRSGGHPGVRLGPIAHALLHHAECPVVVVPRD